MNRQAIRLALAKYQEAERQRQAILDDYQIQSLYREEKIDEAREIINIKYPLGNHLEVRQRAIKLINVMRVGIREWEGIDPEDVYMSVTHFNKLVELAERV